MLIQFQHRHKRRLRHFHLADLAHALLALFLLFEQFPLAGDVATVTFGGDVLADLAHRLASDDLRPDGSLDGDVELLARNEFLELLADLAAEIVGVVLVDERREGVGRLAVEQDVELHEFGRAETDDMVVERGVAFGNALEFVVEVEDNLGKRHLVGQFHAVGRQVMFALENAALVEAELHDRTVEFTFADDLGLDERFFDMVDEGRSRQSGRIVDVDDGPLCGIDFIGNVRDRGHDVHVEFAEETFLHDLHMEQPQEAAAEAEAQGQRTLGLKDERRVVELEFLERGAQVFVLVGRHREHAGIKHGLHIFKAGDGFAARVGHVRDGITHLYLNGRLDAVRPKDIVPTREVFGKIQVPREALFAQPHLAAEGRLAALPVKQFHIQKAAAVRHRHRTLDIPLHPHRFSRRKIRPVQMHEDLLRRIGYLALCRSCQKEYPENQTIMKSFDSQRGLFQDVIKTDGSTVHKGRMGLEKP